nr:hypothetical protein [Tanacetum cinerariifolium]
AAKFVGDFKYLTKEADASLVKHKILELYIERILKAVVSQDIISVVQNASIVDTSDLQTELEHTKERFENCIIKSKTEYAKLWNDWYKKCDECKYDKISYDKAYKDMQQKIERLQAQVGDLKVSKGVNNAKVIAPGMFRICPDKVSREAKKVPNTVSASSRTKPITVSQPSVNTKKGMNSDLNGLSSTGLDNTKTRRPQPRSNTKNDRVPSVSKSSQSRNKEVKVEEHHRNLLLSMKNKHMSSACNSSKIDSQDVKSKAKDVKSKVVCAKCKKCLNFVTHDVCLNNCVNGKKYRGRKQKANVSKNETQKEYRPKVSKPKNVGTHESLATSKLRKHRFLLRWSPTGKMFDSAGKLVAPSSDIACTSNTMESKIKWFPNSTSLLGRLSRFVCGTKGNQGYGKKTDRNGKKVICYNCRGEGHVARKCKEPKRAKDTQYYKEKIMMSDAKDRGVILDAEAEAFLVDVECTESYDESLALTTITTF